MYDLPAKLLDSTDHGEGTEIFIVEGDSAARTVGALKADRFQATIPMQGKPMNPLKANRADILAHPKYADLLCAGN